MTRIAFIGAGNRSISHMAALSQIPDVDIVGIADLDTERAESAQHDANQRRGNQGTPIQATIYTDYREMLSALDPDAVYLCLPPFVHGQLDHDVIDFGKPVLFEKPVAVDIGVAREIADHARESGIINAVGYQKRYSTAVQFAAEQLAGAPIGMVISIRLSGLPGQPWWRVQSQSGGMLVEQHTHAVDLMRYLCGEIESAYAVGGTQLLSDVPNLDIFDVNACTVRFVNGAPGIIGNSCAAPAGAPVFPPHMVHVVSQDKVVSVNESKATIRHADQEPQEIAASGSDNERMNQAFVQAVRTGDPSGILCDFDEAVRTLAVTLACQRSAELGEVIRLADFA